MLTNYPNGIKAAPVVGAGPGYAGWKTTSQVYFVDGLSGTAGGDGLNPDTAISTISGALTKANAYDVIYIMDMGISGTDPNPYQEASANHIIPYAQNNIALIGCPVTHANPYAIQIKGHASATTALIDVRAPMVAIENLGFNRGGSETGGIKLYDEGDTTYQAQGTSIHNCHFKNLRSSAAASTAGGGIFIYGGWNYTITNCVFADCRCGIHAASSAASTVKWLRVYNCLFSGTTTSRDVDIYMAGVHLVGTISGCTFGGKPAYAGAGATAKFVLLLGDGVISDCFFGAAVAGTYGAAGDQATIPTTWLMPGCYEEGGLIIRT